MQIFQNNRTDASAILNIMHLKQQHTNYDQIQSIKVHKN